MQRYTRVLIALTVAAVSLAVAGAASAGRYVVVLKIAHPNAGIAAVQQAGGKIVNVNKLGIATVTSSNGKFDLQLRRSGAVVGVAHDAWFRHKVEQPVCFTARATVTPSTVAEHATCAALFGVPVTTGPDPLGACQWDMRAIGATTAGSYAVNRGQGAKVGDIDTGIDLTHPDLTPNLDVATSCSFIYATTPTSVPAEQVPVGDCSNKAAVQDYRATARTPPARSPRRSTVRASPASPRARPSSLSRRAPRTVTSSPTRSSTPSCTRATSGSTSRT